MHKTLFYFKMILIILFTFNFSKAQVSKIIDEISNSPNLKAGSWSVYAKNTITGEIIAEYRSGKIMYPASNLKLLTTAVALDKLGSDYVFNTHIEYDGHINKNNELIGNLFIRGEGDPTLGSSEMEGVAPYDSLFKMWIKQLKIKGITKIKGNIVGDDSYLDYMPLPGGWAWDDIGNYYAAGTSGLCINENMYYLYFEPSKKVGGQASVIRTEPPLSNLSFINHMKTGKKGSGDNGYIYAAPWQYEPQLEGTIPAGVEEFSIKGSLPDPAKFAAEFFKQTCIKNGIEISGEALTIREFLKKSKNRTLLYSHSSPALKDIVYRLNKKVIICTLNNYLKY